MSFRYYLVKCVDKLVIHALPNSFILSLLKFQPRQLWLRFILGIVDVCSL